MTSSDTRRLRGGSMKKRLVWGATILMMAAGSVWADNTTAGGALNLLGAALFDIGACETEYLGVNTFQGISQNTLEIMKMKYLP